MNETGINAATDDVRETQAIAVGAPTPLEVQLDSQKAIARIGAIAQVVEGCAKTSLQRTNHLDWVRQSAKARDGSMKETFYLQATGAQKIRPIWGIYYRDRKVTREQYPDGTYAYLVEGVVGSKVLDQLYGEVTIEIDGGRSSKDSFFTGRDGTREVDPLDVRKAALANWEARAVTALIGLKNLGVEDLTHNGINTSKIAGVEWRGGSEGGGQTGLISDGQQKRFHAIRNQHRISEKLGKALLAEYGFDGSSKITRAKYDEICTLMEKGVEAVSNRVDEFKAQKAEKSAENQDANPVPFE